jgi:hypothetical protein
MEFVCTIIKAFKFTAHALIFFLTYLLHSILGLVRDKQKIFVAKVMFWMSVVVVS